MRTDNQNPPHELPEPELPSRRDYAEILNEGIAAFEHYDSQYFTTQQAKMRSRRPKLSPVTHTLFALVIANSIVYLKYYYEEQKVLELQAADAQLQSVFGADYEELQAYTTDEDEFGETGRSQ